MNPAVARARGPNFGSVREATTEEVMTPSGKGRKATPAFSAE